jgi:putative hydrolase of the HAD superfamily
MRYLLFDAANTLIHKPALWDNMGNVLKKHGHQIEKVTLQQQHKTISEIIRSPDWTDAAFYHNFNSELLYALGILPTKELLNDIFLACKNLPWEVYEDTAVLKALDTPKAILSNFNNTLTAKINEWLPGVFTHVFTSDELQSAKPDIVFYKKAIELLGVPAHDILYIGDSLKLDIAPATAAGMNAWLIDRQNSFPSFPKRLQSLNQIHDILN